MADRKVRLIIEVDEKDVKATEASLKRLGVAAENVGPSTEKGFASMLSNGAAATITIDGLVRGLETALRVAIGVGKAAFDLAKGWADAGIAIGKAKDITDFQTRTLSALEAQCRKTDVSFDQVGESIKAYTKVLGDANNGNDTALAKLNRLGIDPVKAANNLEAAYSDVVKRIVSLRTPAEQASAAMDAFGEQGFKLIPFFKSFNGDVAEMVRQATDLGDVMSDHDVAASREFDRELKGLQETVRSVGITFGRELAVPVRQVMDDINSWLREHKGEVKSWAEFVANTISGLVLDVKKEMRDLQGLQLTFERIGRTMGNNYGEQTTEIDRIDRELEKLRLEDTADSIRRARGSKSNDTLAQMPDDYQAYREGKLPIPGATYYSGDAPKKAKAPRTRAAKAEHELSAKAKSIIAHADALGISPLDYATLISYETGGTFSTSKRGGKNMNHIGLIQFGISEQANFGAYAGQPFDQQMDAANRYLTKRGVKPGMSLLQLYEAVNAGHVGAGLNRSDDRGKNNIVTHVQRMLREHRPKVEAMFKGFTSSGKSVADDVERMMQQQSDELTKEAREQLLRKAIDSWKIMGLIPDDRMLADFQKLFADEARQKGIAQPTEDDVRGMFRESAAGRQTQPIEMPTIGLSGAVTFRLNADEEHIRNHRVALGLQAEEIDGQNRYTDLILRERNLQAEITTDLEDQALGRRERLVDLETEYQLLLKQNLAAEAGVRAFEQRNDLHREINDLQMDLMIGSQNDGLKIQSALLRDILEIRDRELNAVISINRSQLELSKAMEISNAQIKAGIYEHMAAQKTLNQGIVDGINGTYDAILQRMNEPLDKLNAKSKGLLSFITEPMKAMQAQGLNNVFKGIVDSIIPGLGTQMDEAKNPMLSHQKRHTLLLEKIAANTGGLPVGYNPTTGSAGSIGNVLGGLGIGSGNGPGGTPWFNPTAGGGFGNNQSSGVPPTGTIDADGNYVVNGNQSIGGLGGLFGNFKKMFGPRKNILTGKMSGLAGRMGGVGDLMAMAGGMIGGRSGNLLSMAGTGMSIGSMFGPWGAAIGAGVGAVVGLLGIGKDKSIPKLREAALAEYSIHVRDKSVLKTLKGIGEQYFGNGKVADNALSVVKLDESRAILRNYAEMTNQNGSKIDLLKHQDPDWAGNQFRSQFGGYRANGGPVTANRAYVVGERRPELFVPSVNGTILPAVPNVTTTSGVDKAVIAGLAEAVYQLTDQVAQLSTKPAGVIVREGAADASGAIANANQRAYVNDWRQSENLGRNTGR